jgi:hypothetical protein
MEKYNIILISNQSVVETDLTYEECVDWLNKFGNILDYTIVSI